MSFGDLLLIAGGEYVSDDIKIFDGSNWLRVNNPPMLQEDISLVSFEQYFFLKNGTNVFYTSWESLKKCNQNKIDWKMLTNIPRELSWGGLAVFGHRLIVTNGAVVFAYSASTRNWVHVSDSSEDKESGVLSTCAVVVPDTKDMMILGGEYREGSMISDRVLEVTLNVNGIYACSITSHNIA